MQCDERARAIAANPAILNLLGKICGRTVFPFKAPPPPVGREKTAHSVSVHFSRPSELFVCCVWLAMEDIPTEASLIYYVPGSRLWPIVSNAMIERCGHGGESHSAQALAQLAIRNLSGVSHGKLRADRYSGQGFCQATVRSSGTAAPQCLAPNAGSPRTHP
ncbi:phytanoyl-CoA dioxygenase family protein [Aurantiacibacter flavus]|uniref:phytanoyl-CoA dioxygenase family protein n=1 Tax=Aurantiacibacter flavus TaxID=3145232 RepID=UPI003D196174